MYILGYTDAAQLQHRSTDAVLIIANVLSTHFGIQTLRSYSVRATNTVTELVQRCCV
jgi:hypothetical protein